MTPRKYFRNYVVLVIALFVSGILLIRAQSALKDFDVYNGTIEEIRITSFRDRDQAVIPIVYFTMKGLDAKFGIHENFGDLTLFTHNLKPGDNARIYYNKRHFELSTNIVDHFVAQLEKDGTVLLDIQEGNKENKIAGYVLIAAGLIGTVLTTLYYRRNLMTKNNL